VFLAVQYEKFACQVVKGTLSIIGVEGVKRGGEKRLEKKEIMVIFYNERWSRGGQADI